MATAFAAPSPTTTPAAAMAELMSGLASIDGPQIADAEVGEHAVQALHQQEADDDIVAEAATWPHPTA